ncbi:hypothetical protein RND71_016742 [Anisodus tanguticus]|uniref:Uncharacterized protein n=1 Tax=Anisodus tanguticus TaxID=243964 RepID=A0AAE1S6R9_9SOLA|nr:hypothetical protein RND71_016742 [Anisodus tanguticus]
MSSEKNEILPPPGFPPLPQHSPIGIIDDHIVMHDHDQSKGERATFPVKRRDSRKRALPNLSVLSHSRSSPRPHGQGLRRGRGRPRKQTSDEASPPAPPSASTGDAPLQVPATTNAPVPPLGSSSDRPLEVPFNVKEEERETKLNLNALSRLMHPPNTNDTPQMLDEESKKVIFGVKSLLVRKLLSSMNDVDYMVHQANTTFTYLQGLGANYGSFHRIITEYIEHCYSLQDAEREENMLSLSACEKNYLKAILSASGVQEIIVLTRGNREKVKEKKETFKRQIENLKQELACIEHDEESLEHDEIKYKEDHKVAKDKEQELRTQWEAAKAKQSEIEQRKNAALGGIESATRRLKSAFLDDLD